MLLLVLVFGVVGGVEAYRGWQVVQHVRHGRALLRAGQQQLETKRLDATQNDLDGARADFDAAGEHFGVRAINAASDPLRDVGRHLPLIGGQATAAVSLARDRRAGRGIGLAGIGAAEAFDSAKAEGAGTLPEKTVQVFDSVDPYIARSRAGSARSTRGARSIGGDSLLPPVARR